MSKGPEQAGGEAVPLGFHGTLFPLVPREAGKTRQLVFVSLCGEWRLYVLLVKTVKVGKLDMYPLDPSGRLF